MTLSLAKAIYGNAREEDAGYGVTRVLIQKGGVEVVFQPKGEHVMDVLAWMARNHAFDLSAVSISDPEHASRELIGYIRHDATPEGIAEAVYQAAIQIVSSSSN